MRLTILPIGVVVLLLCTAAGPVASALGGPGPSAFAAGGCTVPRLFKLTVPKAKAKLEKAGCKLGKVGKIASGKVGPDWVVYRQTFVAGSTESGGTKVNVGIAPPLSYNQM